MNQQISVGQPPLPHQQQSAIQSGPHDPDVINLLEYAYVLAKNKWWIIGATVLGVAIGLVAAYVKGPRYVAEVLISAHESEGTKSGTLASLGALGMLIPTQSSSGDASLDKIDQVLDSREFSAALVEHFEMLPEIYRHEWPKTYKKWFDVSSMKWKEGFVAPRRLDIGEFVKGKYLSKKMIGGILKLEFATKDSTFSDSLTSYYLAFLDFYIRSTVQKDANENVAYMEGRLDSIGDPLLREKVQAIIATELEKAMIVSKKAFKVVDTPYRIRKFKEKRLYPLVFGALFFFLTLLAIVLTHAVQSAPLSSEDRLLVDNLKREFRLSSLRR